MSFAPSMVVEEQGGASNDHDNDDSTYHVVDQQMQESGSNTTSPWLLRYSFIISILVLGLSLILMIQYGSLSKKTNPIGLGF